MRVEPGAISMRSLITLPIGIPMLHSGLASASGKPISLLGDLPYIGREGALPGTRELIVPGLPYIVVYRIELARAEGIIVLGVYHGAQLRPGQKRP
jgi:hypothetical protein